MYRIARNYQGLVTHTVGTGIESGLPDGELSRTHNNIGNSRDGLMDGTIFLLLLDDLKREDWRPQAAALEGQLKAHADDWSRRTCLMEVKWRGTPLDKRRSTASPNTSLRRQGADYAGFRVGYMPAIPHWGYNGNARALDSFTGRRPEAPANASCTIMVRDSMRFLCFRPPSNPDDSYLLRVGYGGAMGGLSNIDQRVLPAPRFIPFLRICDGTRTRRLTVRTFSASR